SNCHHLVSFQFCPSLCPKGPLGGGGSFLLPLQARMSFSKTVVGIPSINSRGIPCPIPSAHKRFLFALETCGGEGDGFSCCSTLRTECLCLPVPP
ncbi:unnamed protein product, partial [Bubo scandiacus]